MGLVLDSGEDVTHIVPINEGSPSNGKARKLDIGMSSFVDLMSQHLGKQDIIATGGSCRIIQDIVKTMCYFFASPPIGTWGAFPASWSSGDVYLPDGDVINIANTRY